MDKQIKITAINCSPKENSHTKELLEIFINEAQKEAKVEVIDLYDEDIKPFDGILGRKIEKLTHSQKSLVESDGFIIATPTYWFNEPGILKNFIDNLTPLEENGFLLEGKVAGFVVYSPEGGETNVLENLAMTFNQMGVSIPPYGLIFFRGPKDNWALKDLKLLAKSMTSTIKVQRELIKQKVYEE